MAFIYRAGERLHEEATLQGAIVRNDRWDVFVSHKSNDQARALDVARCIQEQGLSVWVDVLDQSIVGDSPELAKHIDNILTRTFSLLAVVTENTQESWWVPFEIGLAFELRRYLSSYGSRSLLPSFLRTWPNVQNHIDLHRWCQRIKKLKEQDHLTKLMREEVVVLAKSQTDYVSEMSRMARDFG